MSRARDHRRFRAALAFLFSVVAMLSVGVIYGLLMHASVPGTLDGKELKALFGNEGIRIGGLKGKTLISFMGNETQIVQVKVDAGLLDSVTARALKIPARKIPKDAYAIALMHADDFPKHSPACTTTLTISLPTSSAQDTRTRQCTLLFGQGANTDKYNTITMSSPDSDLRVQLVTLNASGGTKGFACGHRLILNGEDVGSPAHLLAPVRLTLPKGRSMTLEVLNVTDNGHDPELSIAPNEHQAFESAEIYQSSSTVPSKPTRAWSAEGIGARNLVFSEDWIDLHLQGEGFFTSPDTPMSLAEFLKSNLVGASILDLLIGALLTWVGVRYAKLKKTMEPDAPARSRRRRGTPSRTEGALGGQADGTEVGDQAANRQ